MVSTLAQDRTRNASGPGFDSQRLHKINDQEVIMLFRRNANLRVLSYNGHVGIPVANGAIEWLISTTNPDLLILQEIWDEARLERALGDRYIMLPAMQPGRGMTYICAKRKRFRPLFVENEDITFGEQPPTRERRRTVAGLRDLKTGRVIVAASVHVAPLGKGFVDANHAARAVHERQVQAYADRMRLALSQRVAIAAGDWNERLGQFVPADLRDRTAIGRMRAAGFEMVSNFVTADTGGLGLDEVFFRPTNFVRPLSRRSIEVPVHGSDHEAVLAVFRVKRSR